MSYQASTGDVPWQVTATVDGTGPNATGNFVPGHKVTFEVPGLGLVSTLFVPGTATPDAAKSLIDTEAKRLYAIRTLTSG